MPERLPQFDESAGNSEESIIAVRSIFSPKNGFKCREELADYGSDLNVELLLDGKQAWNRRFQVQVKSRASVKGDILVNSPVISYKAKVYNLNYLKQGFPVQGLFIIYDVNSQTCYFEFLINILKQLDNTYGDSWKQQENVNIHIPLRNLLTDDAAKRIHKQIVAIYTFTQDELQKRIPDLEKLIQEEEYFTENGSIQVNVFQEVTSIFRNGRELRTFTYRHKILNRIVTFAPIEHADMKLYSLGMGVRQKNGEIDDTIILNQGDWKEVLVFIFHSAADFFAKEEDAVLYITGSTAPRTRLIRMAINLHLKSLEKFYKIYGVLKNEIMPFDANDNFLAYLAKRK